MKDISHPKLRSYTVIACDPGTVNYGISVIKVRGDRIRLIYAGLLQHPMHSITEKEYGASYKIFRREIRGLINQYQPAIVVFERFMNRGKFFGASCEKVSVMLGAIGEILYRRPATFIPVTAAQWKNVFNRGDKDRLKSLYLQYKGKLLPHLIDATLMAYYGARRDQHGAAAFMGWTDRLIGRWLRVSGKIKEGRKK